MERRTTDTRTTGAAGTPEPALDNVYRLPVRPRTRVDPPLMVRFADLDHEQSFRPLRIEGVLPEDLRGTLYRNGPMRWTGVGAAHWFDGLGAVAGIRLRSGRAEGAVRYLHTPSVDADLAAPRPSHGAFRYPVSPARRVLQLFGGRGVRNLANINVVPWQGRLLAMMETTPPVEVDPDTLESLGESDLDGVLVGGLQAHPHRVPGRGVAVHVGVRIGRKVQVDLYALPDGGRARRIATLTLDEMTELHDFALTDRHAVLILSPLWTSPLRLIRIGSFERALRWQPERGTQVVVVDLDDGRVVRRFETEPFFWWHTPNAWEDEAGVHLDLVRYPDFDRSVLVRAPDDLPDRPNEPEYVRGHLDVRAGRALWEPRWDGSGEFPQVHPERWTLPHRYTWMAAQRPETHRKGLWDRLVRLDTASGEAVWLDPGPRRAVGEPTVVPRGEGELDAWVLALVWDVEAAATHLAVWDAARPEAGPVGRAWFDQVVPLGLHGCWWALADR